ncbi:MAG: TlyA family rRNA (cytidine-2'-O)-methyltransferase [Epsilonproteobacteria bacterium]|nr:MAG: TlyA family rRNA (cytidine-2'-O)-methyltransferase [Campylobacterota bacterium]RLA67019.1 MAG: TlyA family rRNA (cytidine-2'-O)-methyltransferase [Campylobacterota bacterium]
MTKDRVDKVLVKLGLVSSRSKAQELIEKGGVLYQGEVVKKPTKLIESSGIELTDTIKYVGRGARKLEGALKDIHLNFKDKVVADVGASTGGFTQIALELGAAKVFCIDVGHSQLDITIKEDPRVENLEGINIKDGVNLGERVDIALVDLSFISLKLVLRPIMDLIKEDGEVLALIKPQFEAGKNNVGKGGVVKDRETHIRILHEIYDFCQKSAFGIKDFCLSPIRGKEGNQEYFMLLNFKEKGISFTQIEALI